VTGYPLLIEARDVKVSEVEFNPDFISRILPKVDWESLCRAAEQLGHAEDLPRYKLMGGQHWVPKLKVPSHQIRLGLKWYGWIGLGEYKDWRWLTDF
jgi:hypothetical protein